MIYALICGECLQTNNVSGDDSTILWVCSNCGNENATSLPTKEDGSLITDSRQTQSLLSASQAAAVKDIVSGEPVVLDGSPI